MTTNIRVPDVVERLLMEGLMTAMLQTLSNFGVPAHAQLSMFCSLMAETVQTLAEKNHPAALEMLGVYVDLFDMILKTRNYEELTALLESQAQATRGVKPS